MWFRTDLRAGDNPALHAAARRADRGVVAVHTICPKQWRAHDMAPVKVDFVLRNLKELSAALEKKNIALRILETATFDGVTRALRGLAREFDCDALYFNREYEVNERRRDIAVTEAFEAAGAEVWTFTDQCMFEPGQLRTGEQRFYSVYTPFKRAWHRAFNEDRERGTPLGPPRKQPEMVSQPDEIPNGVNGFDADPAQPELWPAGERTARVKLAAFIRHRIDSYKDDRDRPAIDGTSTLSPYLASGVISLRQCLAAALDANADRLDAGSDGVVQWISELIWREFYKHILVGFARVNMHRAFQRATERIVWNENDEHFRAWCEGRTGYPIVDAAMRQLVQTGWMHNRLRMIVAMFLSKNLFLDWGDAASGSSCSTWSTAISRRTTEGGSGRHRPGRTPHRTSASSIRVRSRRSTIPTACSFVVSCRNWPKWRLPPSMIQPGSRLRSGERSSIPSPSSTMPRRARGPSRPSRR
jgi:deoxyribodipyrimidine photo-lyase